MTSATALKFPVASGSLELARRVTKVGDVFLSDGFLVGH